MKSVKTLLVALMVAASLFLRPANAQEPTRWAAIAVSPLTGSCGYARNAATRAEAEQLAKKHCGCCDAEVVLATTRPFFAFASGLLGYGTGVGNTPDEAQTQALKYCRQRAPFGTVKFCKFNGPEY